MDVNELRKLMTGKAVISVIFFVEGVKVDRFMFKIEF